jgi:hypothetical protein
VEASKENQDCQNERGAFGTALRLKVVTHIFYIVKVYAIRDKERKYVPVFLTDTLGELMYLQEPIDKSNS